MIELKKKTIGLLPAFKRSPAAIPYLVLIDPSRITVQQESKLKSDFNTPSDHVENKAKYLHISFFRYQPYHFGSSNLHSRGTFPGGYNLGENAQPESFEGESRLVIRTRSLTSDRTRHTRRLYKRRSLFFQVTLQ